MSSCPSTRANLWMDLKRFKLASDVVSKLSKNWKHVATLAQDPKAFQDKARVGRDAMMNGFWLREKRMSEERAEKTRQLEQPQQPSPTACVPNNQPVLQPRVHVLPPDSLSDVDLLHDEATQHSDDSPEDSGTTQRVLGYSPRRPLSISLSLTFSTCMLICYFICSYIQNSLYWGRTISKQPNWR
jgi:hypothetical protein